MSWCCGLGELAGNLTHPFVSRTMVPHPLSPRACPLFTSASSLSGSSTTTTNARSQRLVRRIMMVTQVALAPAAATRTACTTRAGSPVS